MTTDAQNLAGGLGGYQDYLNNANTINTAAEGLIIDPMTGLPRPAAGAGAIGQAQTDFNAASAAAAA